MEGVASAAGVEATVGMKIFQSTRLPLRPVVRAIGFAVGVGLLLHPQPTSCPQRRRLS